MTAVTAALIKELRQRTGVGMMDCKRALVKAEGNIELAIEALRKSGQAKAAKKAQRTAAEGVVLVKTAEDNSYGIVLEANTETDFVARDQNFLTFADKVLAQAFTSQQTDVDALLGASDDPNSLAAERLALIQKVGENINIRRIAKVTAPLVTAYVHGNSRIAVLVGLTAGDASLGKDIAMHVAATDPMVAKPEQIDPQMLAKEKEIFSAQLQSSDKPAAIIDKIVTGKLAKFKAEVSLVEQPFVKDPEVKVGALLTKANADIVTFVRFEVGQGIEVKTTDFATEVKAQAGLE